MKYVVKKNIPTEVKVNKLANRLDQDLSTSSVDHVKFNTSVTVKNLNIKRNLNVNGFNAVNTTINIGEVTSDKIHLMGTIRAGKVDSLQVQTVELTVNNLESDNINCVEASLGSITIGNSVLSEEEGLNISNQVRAKGFIDQNGQLEQPIGTVVFVIPGTTLSSNWALANGSDTSSLAYFQQFNTYALPSINVPGVISYVKIDKAI